MSVELPLCTRCCLCFPLRFGLIVWGYLRLVISALVLVVAERAFSKTLTLTKTESEVIYTVYVVLLGILIVFTLADIIVNILFVIGGHRKVLKLLRAYYIYSIVLWIKTTLAGLALIGYTFYWFFLEEIDEFRVWVLVVDVSTFLGQMLIQAYVILLIRSQIIKLKRIFAFRFIKNAMDCECAMESDEDADEMNGGKCSKFSEVKDTAECICCDKNTND
ncbi:uncharacterized protein LOC110372159 [Helicoverpa armigera]|uniref:uncharacterized protein LOC110372159 n=1 Tax=Helicoverpa armigera TaxID=29058 RepID=UPI0030833792